MSGFVFSKSDITDTTPVSTAAPSGSTAFSAWRHFEPFDGALDTSSGRLLVVTTVVGGFTKNINAYTDPTWGSSIEFCPIITDARFSQVDGALPSGVRSWSTGRTLNISTGFTQGGGFQMPPPQNTFADVFTGLPVDTDLYVHIYARSRAYNTSIIERNLFTMPV
jgi:hypothetical protein